jgi:NADH-quinone oxidoreductase subunit H
MTNVLAALHPMADPLLSGDVGFRVVLIVIIKVVVAFAALLVATMLMVWFERKLISGMQNRVGPNKAGPFGVLQTLADGIKLFFKEDLLPDKADRMVFRLAPYLTLVPAFLVFSVIPVATSYSRGPSGWVQDEVSILGRKTFFQLADPPIGILLVLVLSAIAVYGIMLAGWSSGSKYPLLGSVRASAQMVSYEAALGLSIATVVMIAASLQTSGIVAGQYSISRWNIIATGIVPFVIFVIAATAELNRPPFDLVEAEQELVGGFNTEYSSIRFALFFLAEFMNTITMSGIIVTLFLGGPQPPFQWLHDNLPGYTTGYGWAWGFVIFFAKLMIFLFMYVWFRATLPRLRYDQLMDLGWKVLIPIALGWLMVMASLRLAQDRGWNRWLVLVVDIVVIAIAAGLLLQAQRIARRNRELEGSAY